MAGVAVLSALSLNAPVWLMSMSIVFLFFGLTVAALIFFNSPGRWCHKRPDSEVLLKELQAQNLLAVESFKAKRAFQVQEFEDEGSHYFIPRDNPSVLDENSSHF